jgi:lysozyme
MLIEQLKIDEGFSSVVYKCPAGANSIGYGYNLDSNSLHLSSLEINHAFRNGMGEVEAERILILMVKKTIEELKRIFTNWNTISKTRQDALTNMCFNLGVTRFLKFKKMIVLVEDNDFVAASKEGLNSLWAKQLPARSKRVMGLLISG